MKRVTLVLAAASAVGSLVAVSFAATPSATPTKLDTVMVANNDIRGAVADITSDALTKSDMKPLASHFADADQKRVMGSGTSASNYGTKLDAQIDQISKQWKQKYGHDFQASRAAAAFDSEFASITQGTAEHDAQLTSFVQQNSSAKLTNGQAIAKMDIKSTGNSAEIKVPLIHEGNNQWHVNVPDSLTASRLRDNLETQLSAVNQQSADWPKDENQAYRNVSRHVLMAVLDQKAPAKPQTAAQPAAKSPSANASTTSSWWKFWNSW